MLYFSCKHFRKTWKFWKLATYSGLKGTWASCIKKIVSTDNCKQNIFEKLEKSNKVGQGQKNFTSAFA